MYKQTKCRGTLLDPEDQWTLTRTLTAHMSDLNVLGSLFRNYGGTFVTGLTWVGPGSLSFFGFRLFSIVFRRFSFCFFERFQGLCFCEGGPVHRNLTVS